jgi:pSer/pThr/pTyr-binding forkhead associated (FHA) protein
MVPPAAAAAPGPVIDQTVLYQEPAAAAAAAPAARASGARGVLRGRQGDYQLSGPVTVLGRSRRCDIVLTDPNVSRQHAEVRRQDDGFMLVDLGSTNGTRVNRRDVKQVVLQHGDRIELGTTEFLFERQP